MNVKCMKYHTFELWWSKLAFLKQLMSRLPAWLLVHSSLSRTDAKFSKQDPLERNTNYCEVVVKLLSVNQLYYVAWKVRFRMTSMYQRYEYLLREITECANIKDTPDTWKRTVISAPAFWIPWYSEISPRLTYLRSSTTFFHLSNKNGFADTKTSLFPLARKKTIFFTCLNKLRGCRWRRWEIKPLFGYV